MSDRPSFPPDVAVLGLGIMGRAAALRLIGSEFDVVGWNRTPRAGLPAALPTAASLEPACAASPVAPLASRGEGELDISALHRLRMR